jgi:Mg-chelatase subunit ChlD
MGISRTILVLLIAAMLTACGKEEGPAADKRAEPAPPWRSEVSEGLGAAVVILLDTSGSMKEAAGGGREAKHVVARRAIEQMLEATDDFRKKNPDRRIRVGLMHFADRVSTDLEIEDYDRAHVKQALAAMPKPSGATSLGAGLDVARRALYRSGCIRKYILAVTDGENTKGPEPETVAREIHQRSEGGVTIYFVAFDTDPEKFGFVQAIGGDVLHAASDAELATALTELYEGRILAEAMEGAEESPR